MTDKTCVILLFRILGSSTNHVTEQFKWHLSAAWRDYHIIQKMVELSFVQKHWRRAHCVSLKGKYSLDINEMKHGWQINRHTCELFLLLFFFFLAATVRIGFAFFLLWAALADLGGSLLYSTYPIIPALHPLINYSDTTLHPLPPPDPTVLTSFFGFRTSLSGVNNSSFF